ncbi:MAG: dihydroxyacetone kinase subunit DhaK, partial [Acetanaerobacterium sp.]
VASSPADQAEKRRGVAGLILAYKIAGAAADQMMSLDEVCAITRRAQDNIRSMGVATSPCILPQVGKPTFTIGEGEIEIGMGIHGEPGIEVRPMMTADEVMNLLVEKIAAEFPLGQGDQVVLMVNGLGATPLEELYICYRALHRQLLDRGVKLTPPMIGEYTTSMEMSGLSISMMKVDPQLLELYHYPVSTPFYTNANQSGVRI